MPSALDSAEVWPNFLWRNHGPVTAIGMDSSQPSSSSSSSDASNNNFSASSVCIPIQALVPEQVDKLGFQLLFSLLYFVVWLCAIGGNLSVLYVVSLKHITLPTVRSVFIYSLAVSDVVMSLTSLPITAVSIFTRDWVFPACFCRLMGVFQGGSVFVSSFTLTAIAVDRYLLICRPTASLAMGGAQSLSSGDFFAPMTFRRAVGVVVVIWLLGYSFALPVGLFSSTQSYSPFCGVFCEEAWPDAAPESGVSQMRKLYGLLVLLIQFAMPVAISSFCYVGIGRIVDRQLRRRQQREHLLSAEVKARLETRKRVSSRMMIAMVMGLVLAWLPMNAINLWRDFDTGSNDDSSESGESENASGNSGLGEWYSLAFAACHVIAMTSAAWNPIIYSWFNPHFRETLRRALERRRQSRDRAAKLASLTNPSMIIANGGTGGRRESHRPSFAAAIPLLRLTTSTDSAGPSGASRMSLSTWFGPVTARLSQRLWFLPAAWRAEGVAGAKTERATTTIRIVSSVADFNTGLNDPVGLGNAKEKSAVSANFGNAKTPRRDGGTMSEKRIGDQKKEELMPKRASSQLVFHFAPPPSAALMTNGSV